MHISHGRAAGQPTGRPSGTFSGTVYLDPVLQAPGAAVNEVTFAPGARTFWHRHPGGQLLIVKGGRGLVAGRDGHVCSVEAGDVIWTEPGEEHWHGASPETVMTHTSVSLGQTDWQEEVAPADYTRRATAE